MAGDCELGPGSRSSTSRSSPIKMDNLSETGLQAKPSALRLRGRRPFDHNGRSLAGTDGNQEDLLATLLACAGIPIDRAVGIAKKQLVELRPRNPPTSHHYLRRELSIR